MPLTFDNFLFYFFSDVLVYNCYYQNSKLYKTQQVSKLLLKKSAFKLFYAPIKSNTLVAKSHKFFYNPISESFFKQSFNLNIVKMLSLFYTMGQDNKKLIFFSLKNNLTNISTILTYLSFDKVHADFIFRLMYVLTKKKVKTKRKKVKKILNRLKAHSIFFLTLPKSRKFVKYMKTTSLLTIGLTNLNLFDLNIPILNNWSSYKLLYSLQVYEYYRLGVEFRKLAFFKNAFFKIQNLYNLFFKL